MADWSGGPTAAVVARGSALLARHGRDREEVWDGGHVSLGWRQTVLFAEDRADNQPVFGADDRFAMVADVRLDNRAELIRKLVLAADAAAWPDSRILMAAWERWGERCPDHLAGAFAFAVWDCAERRLFLARDHVGTRPLFFWQSGPRCLFATMASALFALPDVPREANDEVMAQLVTLLPRAPTASPFRDIFKVPTGGSVTVTAEGWRSERYWKPEDLPDLRLRRDDDYVEALREVLDQAVTACLRGVHPIGSHLSSGWDSSTVTATAARLLGDRGQRLTAFTAVPPEGWQAQPVPGQLADEGPLAALVAARFPNIDHVLVRTPERLELDALDRYAEDYGHPRADVKNVGWWERLHADARQRGVRVMLAGGMGNATISYDGMPLLPALVRRFDWLALARHWPGLRADGMRPIGYLRMIAGPYVPLAWRHWLFTRLRRTDSSLARFWSLQPEAVAAYGLDRAFKHPSVRGIINRSADRRAMWIRVARLDAGVVGGGMLAAADVDLRDPTADRRLMEFCRAVPEEQFLNRGRRRWLLRRAMTGILPPELLAERRRGRQAANWCHAAAAVAGDIAAEVERLAEDPVAATMLDLGNLREAAKAWPIDMILTDQLLAERKGMLLQTVTIGRFIRRVRGGNA